MPALVRRPLFWLAVLGLITATGLGLVMTKSASVHGLGPNSARAAVSAPSPFVAVAEGKADIEGGVTMLRKSDPAAAVQLSWPGVHEASKSVAGLKGSKDF